MLKFTQLNKEQKKAVIYNKGPLLIVAGAGTGKTAVITQRLAYLIKKGRAKPEEILAITFTEKAAQEMEERIDDLLPCSYNELWVSTFHSFAKRILQTHGLDIGLSTDFKLLDSTAAWLLIRQNLDKFDLDYYKPLGNPTKFITALISHFSRCKDQVIYPTDYLKYAKKLKGVEGKRIKEIAIAFQKYQELLLRNNLLDFGDLINYCLKLFQKRPLILKEYQKQFKYILVDEFQDTNWAQYQLVKLLSAPKNNLTVCADDDQAIYRFRGASFGNIIQFHKDFPKAEQIVLIKNYRSTQNILNLAHKFIQLNNPNRLEYLDKINKKLLTSKKEKGFIKHLHFKTLEQEILGVINEIISILNQDKEAVFSDFAILVRANESANAFARILNKAKLPYRFMALKGLYSKPIILDIISYFKLLDNYHESSAVYRILNLPCWKISSEDISKITYYSNKKSQSIFQSLEQSFLIPGLSEKTIKTIAGILDLIKKHTLLANQGSVSDIFNAFLEDTGYLKYLSAQNDKESFDYLNQFYDKIKGFEEANLDWRLRNFMEELNLELESGEAGRLFFDIEQGMDTIKLMTIHGAKGLEFKYVFIVNLIDRRFPLPERREQIVIPKTLIKDIIPEGNIYLEEERRLFYVGMTRAKKGLFFTSAEDYGGVRKKKLSLFLKELGYEGKAKKVIVLDRRVLGLRKRKKKKEKIVLPKHFSFSQIKAFENCPLQYKFAHILKIPLKGKAVFSYGKAMHNTLFEFVKKNTERKLNFKELLQIYQNNWIDNWYDSQKQREEYFEAGKRALKLFYDDFSKVKNPILEKSFKLKINGETFIGRIDRIDKTKEGIEIIDYKTGKSKEKLTLKDKEQLLIYQIAAKEVFGLKPEKLSYYYLEKGVRVSFLGSDKEIKKQKEKIIFQIKNIKKSDFLPKPGWQCKTCDFKDICEHARR